MADATHETIIVGAGLAGLSAAYHGGFPLFEKGPRAGGVSDSVTRDGFVFDMGIHVLQSRDRYVLALLDKLGVELVAHNRSGWIYSFKSFSRYPFQVNTSHLPLSARSRCVIGFINRPRHLLPSNYEEWLIRNFGRGFASLFLIPYARRFWGVSPRSMTFDWTEKRVPKPRLRDVVKGAFRDRETGLGTHVVFQYPRERGMGFSAIPRALAKNVDELHYDMQLTAVDPRLKIAEFNHGKHTVKYDRMISTIPLPELIALLPGIPRSVARAAGCLAHNSIAIVNLGVDREKVTEKHWVHFPERDISFFRISFPSNFCDGLCPPGTSSIQAEVSYDLHAPPGRDGLLRQVKADLIKIGFLREEDRFPVEEVYFRRYGYVIYNHSRSKSVREIHNYLASMDIFPCGRYGAWEYLWSDQSILSGKDTGEKLLRMGRQEQLLSG